MELVMLNKFQKTSPDLKQKKITKKKKIKTKEGKDNRKQNRLNCTKIKFYLRIIVVSN
jgi:hypothetical protein